MSYSAKNIEVLKGLEPVRLRPGMYIGNTGRSGLNHLIQELIDNSVDEHLAGYCNNIWVSMARQPCLTMDEAFLSIYMSRREFLRSVLYTQCCMQVASLTAPPTR